MWKEKIIEAYGRSWIKEIEKNVLDFTNKMAKEMIDHNKNECPSLTNTDKKDQLKEKEFTWNLEEYISLYFTKIHIEEELLIRFRINWDGVKKFTQSVGEIYSNQLFSE